MIDHISGVLFLIMTVFLLRLLSKRLRLSPPFLLLPAGILLGFMPTFPQAKLDPETVLFLFLPPLVYAGASSGSWADFKANLRPISLLAIGLVLLTTTLVAWLAHSMVPGFEWPAAFALGAIISPPDDVAALSIARRMRIPQRIVTILEGEGLVNDATSLTVFRFAVAAGVTGVFSFWKASETFGAVVVGEVVYGVLLGWLLVKLRRVVHDTSSEVLISLLTPFLAFLPAYHFGGSGVLATVSAGLYVSATSSQWVSSATRLQLAPIWDTISFILDGVLFLLTGLQFKSIWSDVHGYSTHTLLWYGLAFSVLVIVIRLAWVASASFLSRVPPIRRRSFTPPWGWVWILGWAGMRGAISLAAALALPYTLENGAPFPGRSLIIYITFCVIVSTLLCQGLSLPWLARVLGVTKDGAKERAESAHQEDRIRLTAAQRVNSRLIQVAQAKEHLPHLLARLQDESDYQIRQYTAHLEGHEDGRTIEAATQDLNLRMLLLSEERSELLRLRGKNEISDDVLRRIERDLDLQETRLKQGFFHWELEN